MFTQKGVEEAVRKLAHCLFDKDGAVDVEEVVRGIDFENVIQYLRNHLEPVYSYKATGDCDHSFNYISRELLPQRGTLIFRELERGGFDIVVACYEKELWLMEDMTLAGVMCFSVGVVDDDMTYSTEFRTYKGPMDGSISFDIGPEALEELFLEMCEKQHGLGIPYYET